MFMHDELRQVQPRITQPSGTEDVPFENDSLRGGHSVDSLWGGHSAGSIHLGLAFSCKMLVVCCDIPWWIIRPGTGEITQAFSLAMKMGVKKERLLERIVLKSPLYHGCARLPL